MDELGFLESLPITENYTSKDRYQDFRQVFTGSEQGKRVLREILSWGRLFKPSVMGSPIDPYALAIRDGERNSALKLLVVVNNEPPNLQTRSKHDPR